MCDNGRAYSDEHRSESEIPALRPSRRSVITAIGAVAGSVFLPFRTGPAAAATLTGFAPTLAAMHVHGSWSEGFASWESQFAEASRSGIDLLYLTDHDFRALAFNFLPDLVGVPMVTTATGTFRQRAATASNGSLRLLAESSTTGPASVTMAIEERPTAWNRLRTSIAGQSLDHTFGSVTLTGGAKYQVTVLLSHHPAAGGRPPGQYQLQYRFGATSSGRHLESSGLIGVVRRRTPAAGSTVRLSVHADVAALWPDLLAVDNCMSLVSFTATSPTAGAVADVSTSSVRFNRTQNTESWVVAHQRTIVDTYGARHPGVRAQPCVEFGRLEPHCIPFGVPQFVPDQSLNTPATKDTFFRDIVTAVHRQGGLVSWNHPFGYSEGPLLSPADQVTKRRAVFSALWANNLYGGDILEVGYALRGEVGMDAHLGLWDTFSRRAHFLTGNGVNDDHSAFSWSTLRNGFLTGIWSSSRENAAVMAALAAGRAYTRHAGLWPRGQLDLLVDNAVRMGKVAVGTKLTRSVTMLATSLPANSTLELVSGAVDYTGNDPGTVVVERIGASSLTSTGTVTRSVDTSRSRFFRTQVRDSAGTLIGASNPVWLLREQPPSGIPAPRVA